MAGKKRIVVVGGVAAGMSAASQAKRRLPESEVMVFEKGAEISYGACGMPYNIADPLRSMDDLIVLTPEDAKQKRGIQLFLRHEVVELDLAAGKIRVRDIESSLEKEYSYDSLVIATGAEPVRLPLDGFDLPGVYVLRTLEDGKRLKSAVAHARRAVVVGGGYIGLEVADALAKRGLSVVVLEKLPQVLPGWSQNTVELVTKELEKNGVQVLTGCAVEGALGDSSVSAVVADGKEFPCDLVVVAVGIRPNVRLAVDAGIKLGSTGAIWVSQDQQTSQENVWAAGDCSEAYHRILRRNAWIPLGTTANKQGRIAGARAAGFDARFAGIVGTAGFKLFELEVTRTGLSEEQARKEGFDPVKVVIRHSSRAHSYPGASPIQVLLIADKSSGILLGAEIVGKEGAAGRINVVATALAQHLTVAEFQGLDLVYAPPLAPVWDPLLVAANQLAKLVAGR